jgi:hypothetical protein
MLPPGSRGPYRVVRPRCSNPIESRRSPAIHPHRFGKMKNCMQAYDHEQIRKIYEVFSLKSPNEVADWIYQNANSEWIPFFIRNYSALANMSIFIHAPFYLLQPNPMAEEYRHVLSGIILEAASFGVQTTVIPIGYEMPCHFNARRTIEYRFHCHGRAPNLWHLKDSLVPGRFYCNQSGYSGWIEIACEDQAALDDNDMLVAGEVDKWISEQLRRSITKYAQPLVDANLEQADIFFPLQVMNDTVSALHRVPLLDALSLAAVACAETGRKLRVKRHPLCSDSRVEDALSALAAAPNVEIVNCDVHRCILASDVVMTANSSVGFTALLHRKPVITFGASEYEVCTYSARDTAELAALLRRQDLQCDFERVRRLVSLYIEKWTFQIFDKSSIKLQIVRAISENVRMLDPEEVNFLIAASERILAGETFARMS